MARNCWHLFPMASRLFLSLALPSTLMWFGVGNGIIIITRKKMEAFLPLRGGARRGNTVLVGALKKTKQWWRGGDERSGGGSQGGRTDAGIRVDDELVAADLLAVLPHREPGRRLRSRTAHWDWDWDWNERELPRSRKAPQSESES